MNWIMRGRYTAVGRTGIAPPIETLWGLDLTPKISRSGDKGRTVGSMEMTRCYQSTNNRNFLSLWYNFCIWLYVYDFIIIRVSCPMRRWLSVQFSDPYINFLQFFWLQCTVIGGGSSLKVGMQNSPLFSSPSPLFSPLQSPSDPFYLFHSLLFPTPSHHYAPPPTAHIIFPEVVC